jgi:hypothetical protein
LTRTTVIIRREDTTLRAHAKSTLGRPQPHTQLGPTLDISFFMIIVEHHRGDNIRKLSFRASMRAPNRNITGTHHQKESHLQCLNPGATPAPKRQCYRCSVMYTMTTCLLKCPKHHNSSQKKLMTGCPVQTPSLGLRETRTLLCSDSQALSLFLDYYRHGFSPGSARIKLPSGCEVRY